MANYTLKTGELMTKRKLAKLLWPDTSDVGAKLNLTKLINGGVKRIDIEMVTKLAEVTLTSPNFLFGWKE